ncbi:helix-turn-helix transcriptional regulator [Clostridium estertheticum]|nr:helix-turn-helix transcriptional regulator [Clostridium estertheticum]MCB2308872.1 helix-turn-helix transcriptional regulator [Clostridium estertheticum]MCB2347284.1 helix-turn-helix transcriptional regulator [Clostridium estertheticum]MCB2351949.1 helix-turn-helix transcriptional regulator [Clostridium estertheticum]WAG48531.1 helix-turn-helix transcriptional regulator [Clostridium estertheticum]
MRKNVGLSQKEVGIMIGKSQVYISHIEKGKIDNIPIHILNKLSNVFHISIYEVLRILLETKTLDRIKFDESEVLKQIEYINNELMIFGSLGRVCSNIGIARSTIKKRFMEAGYTYNSALKRYCKNKT